MKFLQLHPLPQPELLLIKNPVFLMHGFGAIGSFNRKGCLHDIALEFRKRGIIALAPNVPPYQTIHNRSVVWFNHLTTFLEITQADKVHLIAHSMGGLEARYLISKLGMASRVVSLTTISSPHQGSSLALYVLEQPKAIRQKIIQSMELFGKYADPTSQLEVEAVLSELTPQYVAEQFNPEVPDDLSIPYYSFSGVAGKGVQNRIHQVLRVGNRILFETEGINDGVVSVKSSKWGKWRGIIEADHMQQIGLSLKGVSFNEIDFYLNIIQMLKELESEGGIEQDNQ